MTFDSTPLYCANHPDVETSLRCNKCEKPICPKCAVATPTGYRCRECVRGQQKSFETALWYDNVLALIIAGVLSYIGSRIVPLMGFFTLLLSPIAGVIIAEAVRFTIKRRRSKRLFQIAALGTVIGSLPILLLTLIAVFFGNYSGLWSLVLQGLYTAIISSTVYYRLSGINLSF